MGDMGRYGGGARLRRCVVEDGEGGLPLRGPEQRTHRREERLGVGLEPVGRHLTPESEGALPRAWLGLGLGGLG